MLIIIVCLILAVGLLATSYFCKRLKYTVKTLQNTLSQQTVTLNRLNLDLIQATQRIEHETLYDKLTGLPNRCALEDRLSEMIKQSRRHGLLFGVLFLDIDGFSVINDALGHTLGDELLKKIAVRLQGTLRQIDTVCRFEGDQFVLLLPQIAKAESCAYIAQRLVDEIAQPFEITDHPLFITASIGIAIFPLDSDERKTLLTLADNAMHHAKMRGINNYQFYQQGMQLLSQREIILNSSLRTASVYHDFSIIYQPQVNIKTKQIDCMEAFLRWQHPTLGLVAAHEFLHLAENSKKIIPIGEWVLQQACQQFKVWKTAHFHLKKIAINISLKQLEDPHFTYKLTHILQATGVKAEELILEISESTFHKANLLDKCLHMLKQMGVNIAIDDFGTGSLSLQQFKYLSVDYLKIGSHFIQEITKTETKAIIRAIVTLANTLHQIIIVKEVETLQQKKILEQLGCYIMQGHLFSAPHSANEFTQITEQTIAES